MTVWDRLLGRPEEQPQQPLVAAVSTREAVPSERVQGQGPRGIVAAAAEVTPRQARAVSQARQKWQRDAWVYRDAIAEVRYGNRWLANASSMITILAAEVGPDGEEPIDLDSSELPPQLIADARAIADDLTGGRGGGHLLGPGVENFEAVGECYLLGRTIMVGPEDAQTPAREWSIRSMDEVDVKPDAVYLKTGEKGKGERLEGDYELIRLWSPHPRFTEWADSPMRALLDPCEELLLIARSVRAAARNRLAGNGLLLLSSGLASDPANATGPDGRPTGGNGPASTVVTDLQRAMVTPIADESSSSAVVPTTLWGEPADLAAVRHVTFERPLDAALAAREERALRRIATGLDVPVEVITGMADVNHWTAWQIDDSSFRHHVAPIVGTFVDSLTVGYFRPALLKLGWPLELVRRVMLWRDPARLVQKPNRGADALQAWDRNALSDDSLLEALGFDPTDKPEESELLSRLALRRGAMDGAITEALLRLGFGPLIDVIRTTAPGQVGVHTGEDPPDAERRNPPALPAGTSTPPAPGEDDSAPGPEDNPPADDDEGTPGGPIDAVTAAGEESGVTDRSRRLSRRLAQINRSLFDRLIAASDDALEQALTRAGNRIRGKANGTEHAAAVRGVQAALVASTVGREVVTASLGLEETELLADAFANLGTKFERWTVDATEEAFDVVAELLGVDRGSAQVQRAVGELRDAFEEARVAAWQLLEEGLRVQATGLLYDPDPSVDELGEVPSTTVRPGLIRGTLAVAGGLDLLSGGVMANGLAAVAGTFLGGLTSGQLLTNYLRGQGAEVEEFEWSYGISARSFPPHRALDGTTFRDFTDPVLSSSRFPGYEWVGPMMVPGDHDGCHCDAALIYADGGNTREGAARIGETAYKEQNPDRPLPTRQATTDPNVYR